MIKEISMPYANNNKVQLYYEVHGPKEARETIVFAHGAGGNALSWWQQIPEFSSTHRVIVFDHRGFSRSICDESDQSAIHFESDLIAILDAESIERVTIVCQSMGGWTGVRTAVNYSQRVNAVLLGNTPGAIVNDQVQSNWKELTRRIEEGGGLVNRAVSSKFVEMHPERALLYQQISSINESARPNLRDEGVGISPAQVTESDIPFLVLASDQDPLFPPDVLASVATDIQAQYVRINGAGHSTYFEKPEAFNAVLAEFLRKTS